MNPPEFTVTTFQNEYLPAGGRDVHAVITVTSAGVPDRPADAAEAADGDAEADAAEIIIIDSSGSMGWPPPSKIAAARRAAATAVDAIRDGVAFAIVKGTEVAAPVYPRRGRLAISSPRTRAAAKLAMRGLHSSGGTAIGSWLLLARQLFDSHPSALRHAILLTDGRNTEEDGELERAIQLCEGVFRCDCRGVGTDWEVSELRKISTALLGTVDIVPEPAWLAAEFEAMMHAAMAKEVTDVMLRVWIPETARVRFVKQMAPSLDDLTGRRAEAGPQTGDYPTGAWGAQERRDYHICVEVEPAEVGQEMRAARVSLVLGSPSGPEVLGQGMIRAIWTNDEDLSTGIEPRVKEAAEQYELAQAIQEGLAARRAGDLTTATAKLGRAVALAHEFGREDTARLLARVVDVVDPVTGTIRLKPEVRDVDEMTLDVETTKIVRRKKKP
jgi:von Willebrand factor type A C-terminal domain/von Willebrand factor type A domain